MHKEMLKEATHEQLKEFLSEFIIYLKAINEDLYVKAEMNLYKTIYKEHFNKWMLDKATAELDNEDGTKGAHWTVEQTNDVARQLNIPFDTFNEFDWNYVMNMMYSDYYGVVDNNPEVYAKLAKKFLCDKDAPAGKALRYYWAMH